MSADIKSVASKRVHITNPNCFPAWRDFLRAMLKRSAVVEARPHAATRDGLYPGS